MFEQIPEIFYEAPLSNKTPLPFQGRKVNKPPPLPLIIVH